MNSAPNTTQSTPVDEFAEELLPGTTLLHGQYTIESFLNSGGFGLTYLARDSLERTVVIKECFPGQLCMRRGKIVRARNQGQQDEFRAIVRLFVQEARRLAKLDHPNIVGVHQVFEDNETAYMALDFVDGQDMHEVVENDPGRLTPELIVTLLKKLLEAVTFVHQLQILHRDISPDNILLDAGNNPVLIDFGAAREKATRASRTLSSLLVVKDGYSPQEFYIEGSQQGPSSDLYALGATFYHILTGAPPPNSHARLAAVASNEPIPTSRWPAGPTSLRPSSCRPSTGRCRSSPRTARSRPSNGSTRSTPRRAARPRRSRRGTTGTWRPRSRGSSRRRTAPCSRRVGSRRNARGRRRSPPRRRRRRRSRTSRGKSRTASSPNRMRRNTRHGQPRGRTTGPPRPRPKARAHSPRSRTSRRPRAGKPRTTP
jgi:serine/threonine protein kinase